ncbi:DUF1501 domain-containing protein [Nocardioides sp. TF02-7]|uniref:DUF1501 domain-containing protein n=1 Tax=Nocardioides sp. TF02-7 TaxID=2917724 RepID=UPI001F052E47|nr:DUF1501 domain-containing protein [Nocardioides sp. TF02-7]UMG91627.1 DUF1501 domain-containing protein [Nocardioides sp. TF02-7]
MSQPDQPCGCPEFTSVNRRSLLRGGLAVAGLTTVFGSTVVSRSTRAAAATSAAAPVEPWTIVVLSLRGAADGLSLVVPHADEVYYRARPRIHVPSDRLLAKDGMFGLHPALAPLLPLWQSGRLAAVHATGLPVANRSHFSAMEQLEDAAPGSATRSGWLNRLLGGTAATTPVEGVAVGSLPTALYGGQSVIALEDVDDVDVDGAESLAANDPRLASLRRMWGGNRSEMGRGMRSALDTVRRFEPVRRTADPSASYPDTDLGRALGSVARTIRGDVGTSVFTVDHGDWDMHTYVGRPDDGWMHDNATELAEGIAAFFADLGALGDRVTLVTISEFGRRTVENASQGLDHGWGNVMFLAGAQVKGGRYYAEWPGLTETHDADLPVTLDYRSVLAEVVSARTGVSTATVFPGFTPEPVGVMRA